MVDIGLLTQTAEPARDVLGVETIAAVADKGYFKIEDIEACWEAGIVSYVPRPQRGPSVRAGFFRKDEFGFDAAADCYVCQAGLYHSGVRFTVGLFGGTLMSAVLGEDYSMAAAISAVFSIGLRHVFVSELKRSSPWFGTIVDETPVVVYELGRSHKDRMKGLRMLESDIMTAVRQQGLMRRERYAIVLRDPRSRSFPRTQADFAASPCRHRRSGPAGAAGATAPRASFPSMVNHERSSRRGRCRTGAAHFADRVMLPSA